MYDFIIFSDNRYNVPDIVHLFRWCEHEKKRTFSSKSERVLIMFLGQFINVWTKEKCNIGDNVGIEHFDISAHRFVLQYIDAWASNRIIDC